MSTETKVSNKQNEGVVGGVVSVGGGGGGEGGRGRDEKAKGAEEEDVVSVQGCEKHQKLDIPEANEFEDMNLRIDILRGIFTTGFEKPSVIQQKGIVIFTNEKRVDLIAQAQSGTGKTATFLVSMMQNLSPDGDDISGLIIVPTRELATQVMRRFADLSQFTDFRMHCCIGGTPVRFDQTRFDEVKPHLIVGTPGRVKHLISEGVMDVDHLKMLVLDEADCLLDQGFKEQLYEIFQYLPRGLQIGLFSATLPPGVVVLAEQFMNKPIKILLKEEQLTLQGIRQFYVDVGDDRNKYVTLVDLYTKLTINKAIIFCNSRRRVDELSERMTQDDHAVGKIHAKLTHEEREKVMKEFRLGETRVLIASGLIGRGIDIHQISLVINYDFPRMRRRDEYLHRIGRSGRFGRRGVAINFITRRDFHTMKFFERYFQTQIDQCKNDINKYL